MVADVPVRREFDRQERPFYELSMRTIVMPIDAGYAREIARGLRDVYAALRAHFGYAPEWWPGTPWEIMLTAVLVQQCEWTTAFKAVERLRESGLLHVPELAAGDPATVQEAIHPVSFAPTKSSRLVELARGIQMRGFERIEDYLESDSTKMLRRDLLSFRGIGDETADCILLYAGQRHRCFVVDAYTRRIFERLELVPNVEGDFWNRSYGVLREFFQTHLLADVSLYDGFEFNSEVDRDVALLRDYHAQLVELGRHHCLKTRARCDSRGRNGWRESLFCRRHCSENGCTGCPLSGSCARSPVPN